MKPGIIIGLFMLLCSAVLGQVIVNADGTHSIQHGPHIINPNGTISVQHGPHIIHSDGTVSVDHGSGIINPNGSISKKQELLNDDTTAPILHTEETPRFSSTVTELNNQKFFFNLRLGSAADRLDRLDAERKSRKEDRKLKKKLIRLWQSVTPHGD